ncbi:formylglycine-generating enzyme family protein [Burkholderia ubonensis]|uniref:formylglycine-generating enzyme family protein n=1 Tax=Burkholderia ubonensis TaxID=101571 RepID=UPI0022B76329|nr:SUMF1/EgtB/PvdO family nonheme iron enzyme [Burkholderia ubonensis]
MSRVSRRYPVTLASSSRQLSSYPSHLANHPVWTVPPEAADAYVAWLARRTGRRFRLPLEAEWEYAASNGDGREFPWGDAFEYGRASDAHHYLLVIGRKGN